MKIIAVYVAAAIVIAVLRGYRGLAPSPGEIQEAKAYAAGNNKIWRE